MESITSLDGYTDTELYDLLAMSEGLPLGQQIKQHLDALHAAREADREAAIIEAGDFGEELGVSILNGHEKAEDRWRLINELSESDSLAHHLIVDRALKALIAGKFVGAYLLRGTLLLRGACGHTKDETAALDHFLRGARAGDFLAMYYVGECHEHGRGTEPDVFQAMDWYQRAQEGCCAEGIIGLARLYHRRIGGAQRREQLRELHQQIMDLHTWLKENHPEGQGIRPSAFKMANDYAKEFKAWAALPA